MVEDICSHCGIVHSWNWEEAFDEHGFNDGYHPVKTEQIEEALREAGYDVDSDTFGMLNTIIVTIQKNGVEQIPGSVKLGYENPRDYLPNEIVSRLDESFPSYKPYQF